MCQALLKALGQSGDQDSQGSLISGDLGSSEGRPSACAHTQMSQATANGTSAVRWQRDVAVRNLGVVSWSLCEARLEEGNWLWEELWEVGSRQRELQGQRP